MNLPHSYILELHVSCYLLTFVRSIHDHYQLKKMLKFMGRITFSSPL